MRRSGGYYAGIIGRIGLKVDGRTPGHDPDYQYDAAIGFKSAIGMDGPLSVYVSVQELRDLRYMITEALRRWPG